MSFNNLTTEAQNLLLVEYSFFFKITILFCSLAFALFYLLYWKREKEQPTVFYSVGILRLLLTIGSWLVLFLSPFALLLLSPDYALSTAVNWLIPVYVTFLIIMGVGLIVDLFYYTPTLLLKIGGFDLEDEKINKAYQNLKRYFKKNG